MGDFRCPPAFYGGMFMPVGRLLSAVIRGVRQVVGRVRSWQVWSLKEPLRSYLLSVITLGIAAITLGVVTAHWRVANLTVFGGMLACSIIAIESTRTAKEAAGSIGRDLQTVWYLAMAVTLPPVYALLAPVPLTAYKLWRVRRAFVYRRVFSNSTICLAYGTASLVFHSVGIVHAPGTGQRALVWCALVAGCGVLAWLVNCGLLLGAVKFADPSSRVREMFGNRSVIVSDVIELSLGVSLSLVVAIDPVLMVLAVPSIVLYRRYLIPAQMLAQARIDAKTGLLNANAWQREAEVEFFRALQGRRSLALAMVVIDDFKDIDQTAGQAVRDQLLHDIAEMLKDQLADSDLIGRFGGEAFAILLPQADRVQAQRISERIRDHVAGEPIAIESGSHEGFVFRLTVSIGVAVLNESRRALAELIGAADTALVTAKSTGWSRVYVLPDGTDTSDIPEELDDF
jgi:diguanylate cyclase (GGDEF)-like protein